MPVAADDVHRRVQDFAVAQRQRRTGGGRGQLDAGARLQQRHALLSRRLHPARIAAHLVLIARLVAAVHATPLRAGQPVRWSVAHFKLHLHETCLH